MSCLLSISEGSSVHPAPSGNKVSHSVVDASDGDSEVLLPPFLIQDHQNFLRLLTQTEDWLYEEGEDQAKQAYVDKLEELMVGPLPLGSGACASAYDCDSYQSVVFCFRKLALPLKFVFKKLRSGQKRSKN